MTADKTPPNIKLDERIHVEKLFLDQLAGLDWEIRDLDSKQHPGDSFRESFTEVVMLPVLREQLKVINPWLEDDQVEEVVKRLTASFPGTDLIKNNRHVFMMLLENTSVSVNRRTGEKSPTVRFVDFACRYIRRHWMWPIWGWENWLMLSPGKLPGKSRDYWLSVMEHCVEDTPKRIREVPSSEEKKLERHIGQYYFGSGGSYSGGAMEKTK